jgi:hypothetical protein
LLTIDVGGVSGFCVGEPGEKPVWGARVFVRPGQPREEHEIDWLFAGWVTSLIKEHRPGLFGIEMPYIPRDPRMLNSTVYRIIGMTRAACAIAHGNGLQISRWQIKEVAVFFGAGGMKSEAKKAHVRNLIIEKLGWDPISGDAADSAAVWLRCEEAALPGIRGLFPILPLLPPALTKKARSPRKKQLELLPA